MKLFGVNEWGNSGEFYNADELSLVMMEASRRMRKRNEVVKCFCRKVVILSLR
jgi:hypothetical protein